MVFKLRDLDVFKAGDVFKLGLDELLYGMVYGEKDLAKEGQIVNLVVGIGLPILEVVVHHLQSLACNMLCLAPNGCSKQVVALQLEVEFFSRDWVEETVVSEYFLHLFCGDAVRLVHLALKEIFVDVVVDGTRVACP
ncbi:hypothetical protein ACA910_000661 [Epithemia clementina (nom. ined.)]